MWYLVSVSKKPEKSSSKVGADQLLARGSKVLGLASVASACGQRAGKGPWYVLSKEITGPAEEVLTALQKKPDPVLLEAAVRAAMSKEPATSPPSWSEPLLSGGDVIDRFGGTIEKKDIEKVAGKARDTGSPRVRGLAALAIAFCRSRDAVEAISRLFEEEEKRAVREMGAFAGAVVDPMEPTSMRERLKTFLSRDIEVSDG